MIRKSKKNKKTHAGEREPAGRLIAAALLLFGGAALFFYPTVSNYMAERHQISAIEAYDEGVGQASAADMEAQWDLARAYNENLAGDPVHDPFVPGSGYALPQNYVDVLNVNGDGVMGYISIPRIGVNLPIYHGTDEDVLQKGAGHIEQTFLPIGGAGSHAVITGHRGLPSAEMFNRLDELTPGDVFIIRVLDETLAYEVDEIATVLPTELEDIRAVEGEDLVTLVTCTPYGVNTHRLLVRGRRTDRVPEEAETDAGGGVHVVFEGLSGQLQQIGLMLGSVVLISIVLLGEVAAYRRRRKKRAPPGDTDDK